MEIEYSHVKHETSKAFLINFDKKEFWVPKSQCIVFENRNFNGGINKVIEIKDWLWDKIIDKEFFCRG